MHLAEYNAESAARSSAVPPTEDAHLHLQRKQTAEGRLRHPANRHAQVSPSVVPPPVVQPGWRRELLAPATRCASFATSRKSGGTLPDFTMASSFTPIASSSAVTLVWFASANRYQPSRA